jgi:hypothetical protein
MVVVMVVVWALTGPVGTLSTPRLAVIATTAGVRANLGEIVGDEEPQLGGKRGVVVSEVGDGSAEAGFAHGPILGPQGRTVGGVWVGGV